MIQALNGLRPFALPSMVARGRGSAPIWTPAANFPLGTEPGLWYDPSTFTGLYQDSAGTSPATAVGQPVGKMLDKSGRNNHVSQVTASARPIIGATGAIQYQTFDGLDDGMSTGAVTLGSDMDCFIAIRTADTSGTFLQDAPGSADRWFGAWDVSASTNLNGVSVGAPLYVIDGTPLSVLTRVGLSSAVANGAWHVVEVRGLNLSTWASCSLCNYGGGFSVNGDIAGVILCPAGDATARQKNRQWLGNKVGLVLP